MLSAAPGCLITDVPEKTEQTYQRPQLVDASPPPTELIPIVSLNDQQVPTVFSAKVLGEDAGQSLVATLIVDYGLADAEGGPSKYPITPGDVIPAGTLADGPRPYEITWPASPNIYDYGCHTVTLLITHAILGSGPFRYCPKDACDVATVTWHTTLCQGEVAQCIYDDCPLAGAEGVTFTYCDACGGP